MSLWGFPRPCSVTSLVLYSASRGDHWYPIIGAGRGLCSKDALPRSSPSPSAVFMPPKFTSWSEAWGQMVNGFCGEGASRSDCLGNAELNKHKGTPLPQFSARAVC